MMRSIRMYGSGLMLLYSLSAKVARLPFGAPNFNPMLLQAIETVYCNFYCEVGST